MSAPSPSASVRSDLDFKIVTACTINKPAAELYALARDFSRLLLIFEENPRFSQAENRFEVTSTRNDWRLTARFIQDKPGAIAWRSEPDSDLRHACTLRFDPAPADEGTEVTVTFEYEPGGGKLGGLLAEKTHAGPRPHIVKALRRFKAFVETGEMPTIAGQPVGEPQKSKRGKK